MAKKRGKQRRSHGRRTTPVKAAYGPGPNNSWSGCPEAGRTPNEAKRAENRLKNRNTVPTGIDPSITLNAILQPGDDSTRFRSSQGAHVTGYLVHVERGGPESCNCKSKNWRDYDIHIELVEAVADADNPLRHFIAEITPRWRDRLGDYGKLSVLQKLQDRKAKVRVTGQMFFDPDHKQESENTNPGGNKNWRATAWEIHPITEIAQPSS